MAVPKVSISTQEAAACVEFSPYEESSDLLAIGSKSRVTVKAWPLQDPSLLEPGQNFLESLSDDNLFAVSCGSDARVSNISWSPQTYYSGELASSKFLFSMSGMEHSITIYLINPATSETTSQVLHGHLGYVNDLCHHPSDPALLASVGDDGHCRLWDLTKGQMRSKFKLGSPGVNVKWHPQDPVKLLVAEKRGRIRLYDLSTEVPIQSLDAPLPPLLSADWSPTNPLAVGGVCTGDWCIWDLSKSSQPLATKSVCQGFASKFRWCYQSDNVFATIGLNSQVKVHHFGHQKVPISYDLPIVSDLSWHARLPVLAVASDEHIHLWIAET